MLNTDHAISRVRRDLALGFALKAVLLLAGLAAVVVVPQVAPHVSSSMALLFVALVWLVLSYNSAKGSRAAADVPTLIAAGLHEEAEEQIDAALKRFSLIRVFKLQTLYQLAVLRHAQKRHRESAAVCRELLRPRSGAAAAAVAKPVRLLLADASLELDDLPGVHAALAGLYGERLSLAEVLQLLAAQLDYEARIGAWGRMTHEVMTKVQLAELMPAASAARAQAFLALAAGESGRADFRDWLRDRAALLADPADLVARRPMLAELWAGGRGRVRSDLIRIRTLGTESLSDAGKTPVPTRPRPAVHVRMRRRSASGWAATDPLGAASFAPRRRHQTSSTPQPSPKPAA